MFFLLFLIQILSISLSLFFFWSFLVFFVYVFQFLINFIKSMTPMYIFQIQLQLVVKFNFNTSKYTQNILYFWYLDRSIMMFMVPNHCCNPTVYNWFKWYSTSLSTSTLHGNYKFMIRRWLSIRFIILLSNPIPAFIIYVCIMQIILK